MGGREDSDTCRRHQRPVVSRRAIRSLHSRRSESVRYDRNDGGACPDGGRDGQDPSAAHQAAGDKDSGPGRTRSRSCSRKGRGFLRCGSDPCLKAAARPRTSSFPRYRRVGIRPDRRSSAGQAGPGEAIPPAGSDAASQWRFSRQLSCSAGPLAHPEEQGTFNPKVPGSRPGGPPLKDVFFQVTHDIISSSAHPRRFPG